MDKNEEQLDPLSETRNKVPAQKAGDKPANDVLNAEILGPNAKSQFVHSTRREEGDRFSPNEPSEKGVSQQQSEPNMPDTERLTEDDWSGANGTFTDSWSPKECITYVNKNLFRNGVESKY